MESQLSLVRSVSWNYVGYFFEFGSGLLLLAYVVRRIPIHDYGIFLLAQSLAAFLYLLELGIGNIVVPLYVTTYAQKGIAEVSRIASTLVLTLLVLGAAGALALSLLAFIIPQLLRLPGQGELARHVLVIMSVAVMLTLPQMPLEQLCKSFHRFDRVNQIQVAAVMLRVILTIAVLAAGKGIVALATVQVAVALLRLSSLWLVAPAAITGLSLTLRFHRILFLEALRMSKWAFGDDISRRIGINAEQVILGAFGSFEQVALFGVGSRLPAHFYQFAARGLSVLSPTLSQHHAEGDTAQLRATFSSALRICLTGMLPLVTFAAISSRSLLSIWAGPAYLRAAPVLAFLLISALSIVLVLPSDMVLYSHNRIGQAARLSIFDTLGKIAVALALAARYGAVGVAAGVAIWHLCMNLFGYLPAACKVAEISPLKLWRAALTTTLPPKTAHSTTLALGSTYIAGVAALVVGMRLLSTSAMFVACILISLLYAEVWIISIVLPMWRHARTEASAIP